MPVKVSVKSEFKLNQIMKLADEMALDLQSKLEKNVSTNLDREVPVDTGNAKRSREIDRNNLQARLESIVGYNYEKAPYIPYVYYGLPNGIKPKGKENGGADVLHWVDKSGNDVFARFVGPRKPNKWVDRAYNKSSNDLGQILTQVLYKFMQNASQI